MPKAKLHLALLPALACSAALAQPGLRTVEEGIDDASPLARSTRLVQRDLRKPIDFERVYELTSPDGKVSYVRIDGGLAAVFPQSVYNNRGDAPYPPGLVFHIGTEGLLASARDSEVRPTEAPNRLDTRIDRAAPQRTATEPEPAEAPRPKAIPGPPEIITNEIYRRLRIAQLLASAIEPA